MCKLKDSIQVGTLTLSNRLVMPPMASGKLSKDDTVTDTTCTYYGQRAKGGHIGLIIAEHAYISPEGKAHKGQLSISRDSDVDGLAKLVSVIQKDGTKAFAQISHAGAAAASQVTGCPVLGPSAASDYDGDPVFKNMDLKTKAMDSGDIKKVIREAVGKDYPLAIRLGACDYMDGGTTLEDSIQAAKYLEAAGIDLLDISGGLCGTARPGHSEPGYFSELSQGIKENVSIPVMVTGGVRTPEDAKKLLADGKADLIGVGRALIKDPDWAALAENSDFKP